MLSVIHIFLLVWEIMASAESCYSEIPNLLPNVAASELNSCHFPLLFLQHLSTLGCKWREKSHAQSDFPCFKSGSLCSISGAKRSSNMKTIVSTQSLRCLAGMGSFCVQTLLHDLIVISNQLLFNVNYMCNIES